MIRKTTLTILICGILCLFIVPAIAAEDLVVVNFYYSSSCGTCEAYKPYIRQLEEEQNYTGKIQVNWKEVGSNTTNRQEWRDLGFYGYPSVAIYLTSDNISEATTIPKADINYENLTAIIDDYLAGIDAQQTFDETIIDIPFFGRINTSSLSLPVLTVVLGVVDSFNVCSIFILFILLSLLVHAQSRKRMILVGGIFVFFSALWYLLFMFVLQMIFCSFHIMIISFVIGAIALIIGVINIKDFFFSKKGVSIGIPEEKKPGIYRQMRQLVKAPSVLVAIVGTILLAVTVNLFELVCSFALPAIYVSRLTASGISPTYQFLYIVAYNIIYVIPLVIIVILFAFSLGKITLSEQQGQKLKLFSGIMISSFGLLFLFNYKLVENIVTPVAILGMSIIATIIISYLWKRYRQHKETNVFSFEHDTLDHSTDAIRKSKKKKKKK